MTIPIIYSLSASLIVMIISLVGVIFVWKPLERYLNLLVSFSAGVFIVVAYSLLSEIHESALGIVSVIIGIVVIFLISLILPETQHKHEPGDCCDKHEKIGAKRMLIGDGIHNIGDGILLASSFLIDIHLGLIVTIGIIIHEFVQEISEFFVLKESGYTTSEALKRNFLVSGTILIGVALVFILSSVGNLEEILLGLAAGSFIYIVVIDLIPKTVKNSQKQKTLVKHIVLVVLGAIVMFGVSQIGSHSHEHEHETGGHLAEEYLD